MYQVSITATGEDKVLSQLESLRDLLTDGPGMDVMFEVGTGRDGRCGCSV